MAEAAPPNLLGQTLGQFTIVSELGRGGMAVVYKGTQASLGRDVAIKTLPIDRSADREMVARFHREADAMVALNHTNIVQIIDRGEDQGVYFFAMEFVEGPSLKDLLKQETMSMDLLFDILIQVCEGLAYAHKKGIVHRDIKPANILFEKATGLVKIADFGIARVSKKEAEMITLTVEGAGMGTMNYMAPEQKTDAKSVDHRADIYSLGVMIYEMFTGKLPLGKFKLPSQMNPKLPRKLDELVNRCLETEPADRYQTMDELRADLGLAREAAKGGGTLVRSVRDAAERTLTAMSGGGGGGGAAKVAACLIFFLGLSLVGGGAFVFFDPLKLGLMGKLTGGGGTVTETGPTTTTTTPATTPTTSAPQPTTSAPQPTTTNPTTTNPTTTASQPTNPTTTPRQPTTTNPTTTASQPTNPTTTAPQPTTTNPTTTPPNPTTTPPNPTTTPPNPTTTPPQPTTTPQPVAARLTDAELARWNDIDRELGRELPAFQEAARAMGVDLEGAFTAAQRATQEAIALRDRGDARAIESLDRARAGLRQAARQALSAEVERLLALVREEGLEDEARPIDAAHSQLATRPALEHASRCAELVAQLHGLRLGKLREATQLAFDLAAIRASAEALTPLRQRLDDALRAQSSDAASAAAKLDETRAALIALRGPTPSKLRFVDRQFSARFNGSMAQPVLWAIAPAADAGVAVVAPGNDEGSRVLYLIGVQDRKLQVLRQAPIPLEGNVVAVAPAGRDAFWIASNVEPPGRAVTPHVARYRLTRGGLVEERRFSPPSRVYDLDAAPDGTLLVATQRDVLTYQDDQVVGAAVSIEAEFTAEPAAMPVPRRLAALVGGGWVVTGHAPTLPAGVKFLDVWGERETRGEWSLTVRGLLPGDERLRQLQLRGLNLSAVAACGDGVLFTEHRGEDAGGLRLLPRTLEASPRTIEVVADGEVKAGLDLAQDLAVTGRYIYALEKVVLTTGPKQFRRRLVVYAIE